MKKLLNLFIVSALAFSLQSCGIEQVDEGYRGIETNWGKVVGEPLPPGLYFYNPISTDIMELTVREQKWEDTTQMFTKDTQTVTVSFAVNYFPDQTQIGELYKQFGRDWASKLITQTVLGSMKNAIGQYVADELVQKRGEAKAKAETEIIKALKERGITVTKLEFTNLDFQDEYEKAVEAKVVAVQRSAEAKNKTVQVQEEANQKVLAAQADAEAMKIKSQALSQNKGLVQYELAMKWDGKLPVTMIGGNTVPMINLNDLNK